MVINLNKVRKAKAKDAAAAQAAENRVKFGRTKAERQAQAMEADRGAGEVDSHKRER